MYLYPYILYIPHTCLWDLLELYSIYNLYKYIFKGIFMVYIILFLVSLPGYSELTSCFLKSTYPILKEMHKLKKALIKHQYETFITLDIKLVIFFIEVLWVTQVAGRWVATSHQTMSEFLDSCLLLVSGTPTVATIFSESNFHFWKPLQDYGP